MKILTLGGGFIAEHLPYDKITKHFYPGSDDLNDILNDTNPDVVINCIGKTGKPNIDECENNQAETALVNTALPIDLALTCGLRKIHLIQIGSGCIFFGKSPNISVTQGDGSPIPDIGPDAQSWTFTYPAIETDKGWVEENFANPKSFYSKSKYACDLVLGSMPGVTTLRIRMPVSALNHPRNLINKLRGYKQIINIPNSMTFMSDLVRCVDWAAHKKPSGIFHVVNPQPLTAVRIMNEYQKYVSQHSFEIITEEQLDKITLAKRSNCILDSLKLTYAGFTMTASEEALQKCMQSYIKNM